MEIDKLLLMILIGGLIGYITNKVAIKMLFRPINPIKVLFFTFQGVFPKRKNQMAISLADTIEKELLNPEVIMEQLLNPDTVGEMKEHLKTTLVEKLSDMIPPMAKMFLGDNIDQMIQNFLDKEGDKIFDDLIVNIKDKGVEKIDIHELVKNRIDALDFVEFEKIIFGLMNSELRHIEIIGLFLGMIIGLLQYFVTILL